MSPFWWLTNIRYFIYFLREFTGPVIAFYTIYFLVSWYFDPAFSFINTASFSVITQVALVFSIIHSITWFWVTAKLTPISSLLQKFFFIFLIILWVGVSYFLEAFFYFSA